MAVSPSKNFLAVCERSDRAICTIYEIKGTHVKKRKTLSQSEYASKEFVSAAFSSQEKSLLVTIVSAYFKFKSELTASMGNYCVDVGQSQVSLSSSYRNHRHARSLSSLLSHQRPSSSACHWKQHLQVLQNKGQWNSSSALDYG